MGRKPKWSGPTAAIRVPSHLAEQLLDLARQLDDGASLDFVQKTERLPQHLGPYLIGVNDQRYFLPAQTLSPELQEQAAAAVDELMEQCDRAGVDFRAVFSRLVEAWLEPLEKSA